MMLKLLAMFQAAVPEGTAQLLNPLALVIYMLWNEVRHRKNGHNGIALSIQRMEQSFGKVETKADLARQLLDDKFALIAKDVSGMNIRVDIQERRLRNIESFSHEHRQEVRGELTRQGERLSRLEGRYEAGER